MVTGVEEKSGFNDERNLLLQIKKGNQGAFEHLVLSYQKKIYIFAYGFFADRDEAMEIVQETFIRVYKNIDRFVEGTSFANWIFKIASNLCIDHYRKFKKVKFDSADLLNHLQEQDSSSRNPEEYASREIKHQELKCALMRLPKRQKLVFTLKHFGQKKMHEISRSLGIAIGTVKSLHFKAVQRIKQQLNNTMEGKP